MSLNPTDLRSPLPSGDPNLPVGTDGTPPLAGPVGDGFLWLVTNNATGETSTLTTLQVRTAIVPAIAVLPTVAFVSPSPLTPATLAAGGSVVLQATASDASGIDKVEFYEGATLLGIGALVAGAYQLPYTVPTSGTHTLTAKAYALSGKTRSASTFFFVGAALQTPPPPAYSNFVDDVAGGSVTLTPGVPGLTVYYKVTALGTEVAAPANGIISLGNVSGAVLFYTKADAQYTASNVVSTPAFTSSAQLPTVSFIAPVNGGSVPSGTVVLLRATASAAAGVDSVEFFNGSTSLGVGVLTAGAYQLPFTTPTSGFTMNLTARATATGGGTAGATTFFFLSAPAAAPSITSFTPTTGLVETVVSVTGSNLGGLSSVKLNGLPALFASISSTQFSFTVPVGATSGVIAATATAGTAASTVPFAVGVPATAPGAPTGVTATAGNATVTVDFSPAISSGGATVTSNNVYRNSGASPVGTTSGLSYTDTTVTNGLEYIYQIAAVNAVGEGAKSAPSNIATPSAPPVTTFNSLLTGPSATDATGITLTTAQAEQFRYNSISGGDPTGKRMNISIGGALVAAVDFPASYLGAAFLFTPVTGSAHSGVFTDGNVSI